ncbi:hypothetical protein AAMO2058_000443900 [Amorphochlora amoebiformis]
MDSKNSFSTAESRRVYQTFPTYGNSIRGFDTDDGETSDSRFGDSTYEFKNSLRKGIAEGEILEHELEQPEGYAHISGISRRSAGIFAIIFGVIAAVQISAGLWSRCYSLVSVSTLAVYMLAILTADAVSRDSAADRVYVISALNALATGVLGSISFAVILHALQNSNGVFDIVAEHGKTVKYTDVGIWTIPVWSAAFASLVAGTALIRAANSRRPSGSIIHSGRQERVTDMGNVVPEKYQPYPKRERGGGEGTVPSGDGMDGTQEISSSAIHSEDERSRDRVVGGEFNVTVRDSKQATFFGRKQQRPSSIMYSVVSTDAKAAREPVISSHIRSTNNKKSRVNGIKSKLFVPSAFRWNLWFGLVWGLELVGVLLVSYLAWRKSDVLVTSRVDITFGIIFCFFDLFFCLRHLRYRLFTTVNQAIKSEKACSQTLKSLLEIEKERVESAERRREQGEIRLLGLLRQAKESANADRQQAEVKLASSARRLHTLQGEYERISRHLKSVRDQNGKANVNLRTARFESKVARAEAQKLQGELARCVSICSRLKTSSISLIDSLSDTLFDQPHAITQLEEGRAAILAASDPNKNSIDSKGEAASPRLKGSRSPYRIRPDKHIDAGSSAVVPDGEGMAPDVAEEEDRGKQGGGTPKEGVEKGKGTEEMGDRDLKMKVEELMATNRILEERNKITNRQAKESVLSSMTESLHKMEAENKSLNSSLTTNRKVISYLESQWMAHKVREIERFDKIKTIALELQSHVARTEIEMNARMDKIHQAEKIIKRLRPSLGITAIKTPNPRGITIKSVETDCPLHREGARDGHIIMYVDEQKIESLKMIQSILNKTKPGDHLSMLTGTDGPEGNATSIVTFQVPFEGQDKKIAGPKTIRDIWRVDLGLVRIQDLDPKVISNAAYGLKPAREIRPKQQRGSFSRRGKR